jgi:purine-nucleoside phosphorylase
VTGEQTTSRERQETFGDMVEIALQAILSVA